MTRISSRYCFCFYFSILPCQQVVQAVNVAKIP
jgi:hypothetical protein